MEWPFSVLSTSISLLNAVITPTDIGTAIQQQVLLFWVFCQMYGACHNRHKRACTYSARMEHGATNTERAPKQSI